MLYKLSPSDLTFLWDGCKHCFYLKVKHNIVYRGSFPSIFGKMANLTSYFYQDKSTSDISTDIPPGRVKFREKWVKSAPISIPGSTSQCYIRGRFDAVIEFDDGSYGVVDYKTSDARDEHAAFYSRQLSAYAYALENPASKALHLSPVSWLGLFVISPDRFEQSPADEMVFVNRTTWMDIPRDDGAFLDLLGEVVAILDAPKPPAPSSGCELCKYRNAIEEFNNR